MSGVVKALAAFAWALLAMFVAATAVLLVSIVVTLPQIPRIPDDLTQLISVPPTEVFASDGSLISQVGGRSSIPLERVAREFTQAILAVEDDQFHDHSGIDKPALLRATFNALAGNTDRGGSTISQQLARNLFFSFDKTVARKFKEILATLEIERRFSKDEILEAYINGVYFGNFAYGVEEAARVYFGKHASELSLAEAALLAGLPQSPSRYNPYRNPELAKERQHWVLSRLRTLGWISDAEHDAAIDEELTFRPLYEQQASGSYFLDAVLDELERRYGETVLYHGGLRIFTTMDPLAQEIAVRSLQDGLADLDRRLGLPAWSVETLDDTTARPQGALVCMETATGAVRALVGGRDWRISQFNRAFQSSRNMGSVLKPVLYLTAIERLAVHPASMVSDSSITVQIPGARDWTPRNFTPYFYGVMPLKQAMMRSINTVAAKLVLAAGPENMVNTLARFNVRTPQEPNPSIALGATSVNAIELAGIGAGIANLGATVEPYLVRRVEDLHGRVLEEHIVRREQAFDPDDVYLVIDMMRGVIDAGTGESARRLGFDLPAIGKTGTTDDFRDSWFLGATPRITASAWVGFDDNRPMRDRNGRGITGASGALPLWAKFMNRATEGDPPREFRVPPGVDLITIDPHEGIEVPEGFPGGLRVSVPRDASLPDYRLLRLDYVEDWSRIDEIVASFDEFNRMMSERGGAGVDTASADTVAGGWRDQPGEDQLRGRARSSRERRRAVE
ncbi:MAG: Penicillin-binding protein 2D [Calditrichaeota bacterium]|nr:Penicillin-binding protein 2D [Calditrichota bacterium]